MPDEANEKPDDEKKRRQFELLESTSSFVSRMMIDLYQYGQEINNCVDECESHELSDLLMNIEEDPNVDIFYRAACAAVLARRQPLDDCIGPNWKPLVLQAMKDEHAEFVEDLPNRVRVLLTAYEWITRFYSDCENKLHEDLRVLERHIGHLYLGTYAVVCPKCDSLDLHPDDAHVIKESISVQLRCKACQHTFFDVVPDVSEPD